MTLNLDLKTKFLNAMNWLLCHMEKPNIDAPIFIGRQNDTKLTPPVDEGLVNTLVGFGFEADVARKALGATGGDIE